MLFTFLSWPYFHRFFSGPLSRTWLISSSRIHMLHNAPMAGSECGGLDITVFPMVRSKHPRYSLLWEDWPPMTLGLETLHDVLHGVKVRHQWSCNQSIPQWSELGKVRQQWSWNGSNPWCSSQCTDVLKSVMLPIVGNQARMVLVLKPPAVLPQWEDWVTSGLG